MKDRVPDFMLERLALGELAPDEATRVRAGLGDEADALLTELARDDAEILATTPPALVASEVRRRLARDGAARASSTSVRWWVPAGALLAAGALAWWWARIPELPRHPGDRDAGGLSADGGAEQLPEVVRIKGDAVLTIDRLGPRGPEPVRDGDEARAGDRLQLQYRAADRDEGAIVSIDGRGVATLHYPAELGASPTLRTGGTIPLDHSYELDDAPGFERFIFVTAEPGLRLRVELVMRAAETLARSRGAATDALVLPNGYEQRSLSLRKPDSKQ
jgi:hypothetical protein